MNTLKSYIYFIFGAALLLGSCSSDDDIVIDTPKGKVEKAFYVRSSKQESRLGVDNFDPAGQNIAISWETDDAISVFPQGTDENERFTFTHIVDYKNNGAFAGTATDLRGTSLNYYLLYPCQDQANLDNENFIHCVIPAVQNANNGTFDPQAGLQAGVVPATSTSVQLHHVCSYLHLTVDQGCNKIELQTTESGWNLAGGVKVSVNSSSASIVGFDSGVNKVTLVNTANADGIYEGGTFIIAIVPTKGSTVSKDSEGKDITTYSSPIKVTVKNAEKRMQISRTLEAGQSYGAGEFRDLGTVKFPVDANGNSLNPIWTN